MQISETGVVNVQNSAFQLGALRTRGAKKNRKGDQNSLPCERKFKIKNTQDVDYINITRHGKDKQHKEVMRDQQSKKYLSRKAFENYYSEPFRQPLEDEDEISNEYGSISQQNLSWATEESCHFKINQKDLYMRNQHINSAVSSDIISEYSLLSDCECLQLQADISKSKVSSDCEQDVSYENMQSYGESHLHLLSDAECLKELCTSKESIHFFRIETIRKRMLITLDKIHNLINNVPEADGVEDLRRRQQRSAEFSNRFCRNYLYQLQRQINDIRKQLRSVPTAALTQTYHLILCQKMVGAHQNAQHALQAYLHHMPCGVRKGIPDKLQELLYFIKDLCSFCSEAGIPNDCSTGHDEIEKKCQDILVQMMNRQTQIGESNSAASHGSVHKKGKKFSKKKPVQDRFAMYNTRSKWKSYCKEMANNSKKKVVGLPDERDVNAASDSKKLSCSSSTEKLNFPAVRPGSLVKKHAIAGFSAMDDVTTMMDTLTSTEKDEDITLCSHLNPEVESAEDLLMRQLQKAKESSKQVENDKVKKADRIKSAPTELSEESLHQLHQDLEKLQESVRNTSDISDYQGILSKLHRYLMDLKAHQPEILAQQSQQQKQEQERLQELQHSPQQQGHCKQQIEQEQEQAAKLFENLKQSTSQKHSSSGAKNVKLICLPPAESAQNDPPHPDSKSISKRGSATKRSLQANTLLMSFHVPGTNSGADGRDRADAGGGPVGWEPLRPDRPIAIPPVLATETQHYNTPRSVSGRSQTACGTDALTSAPSCTTQLSISEAELASALAYRRSFQHYTRSQSIYQEPKRPWLMVGRIADYLTQSILCDVLLNDVGIQRITEGLLELEFK